MASEPVVIVPHRPPRRPQAWWMLALLSQAAVGALWWWAGWRVGLPVMVATHLLFLWGVLRFDSALFSPVLRRLPTTERVVWLTIDDGPSDETTAMLDLLDAHAARATFFIVADRAARQPELVREIVRRGHGIGNHSLSHPAKWFWALGPARMRREIEAAQQSLTELTGEAPRWFRAVVGMANPFVSAPLKRLGLARVAWSARGLDGAHGNTRAVVARIERALHPGAIVLVHEGARHGRNVEMMTLLLDRLDALGYRCVLPVADDGIARPATHPTATVG